MRLELTYAAGIALVLACSAMIFQLDKKFREQLLQKVETECVHVEVERAHCLRAQTHQSYNLMIFIGMLSVCLVVVMYITVDALDQGQPPFWSRLVFMANMQERITIFAVLWRAITAGGPFRPSTLCVVQCACVLQTSSFKRFSCA
jgi:membrane-associated HD superfamily phosphohydrolase